MVAVSWSALALLAATLFGVLFHIGGRIDGLESSLGARIDALGARLDAHVERHAP